MAADIGAKLLRAHLLVTGVVRFRRLIVGGPSAKYDESAIQVALNRTRALGKWLPLVLPALPGVERHILAWLQFA
jgi:hypothetical protein